MDILIKAQRELNATLHRQTENGKLLNILGNYIIDLHRQLTEIHWLHSLYSSEM